MEKPDRSCKAGILRKLRQALGTELKPDENERVLSELKELHLLNVEIRQQILRDQNNIAVADQIVADAIRNGQRHADLKGVPTIATFYAKIRDRKDVLDWADTLVAGWAENRYGMTRRLGFLRAGMVS